MCAISISAALRRETESARGKRLENPMASSQESVSMALFCDFENVALGVRDAKYEKFDIKPVLERLLLKGSIVVKKAYCDWDRYKGFKAAMHEANFELIEIPHVRQSGKNSADIRLVVDALDLCYTKSHVDTFVIISGDSDFSPLVSKLRENAKKVIGVGVKNSTSDLLVANCDEFIFYDDLVREQQRAIAKRERATREAPGDGEAKAKRTGDENRQQKHELEARKAQAIEIAVETFDALVVRARRERQDLGVGVEERDQAAQAGFQRVVLRLPRVRQSARRSASARAAGSRTRREVGCVCFRGSSQGGGEGVRPQAQAESDVARAVAKAEQGGKRRKGRGERNQAVAGVEAVGDVLEVGAEAQGGHGGNRREDRDGRKEAPGVDEAVSSESQADVDEDEAGAEVQAGHGGNRREDRDGRGQMAGDVEAVTPESQSEADAGEAGVEPQADHGGNRRKDRDGRRHAPAVSEAVTPESQADVGEAGAEVQGGQRGNRRKDRHGRGQAPAFVEFAESDETQAVEWFDAVQALGTEAVEVPGTPEAPDNAQFAFETRETPKASKPAPRRGRKTAAKKAAASVEPTVHEPDSTAWLFADDTDSDADADSDSDELPPEVADTTLGEPRKPSRKSARKTAPRARRPRKSAAGSEQ